MTKFNGFFNPRNIIPAKFYHIKVTWQEIQAHILHSTYKEIIILFYLHIYCIASAAMFVDSCSSTVIYLCNTYVLSAPHPGIWYLTHKAFLSILLKTIIMHCPVIFLFLEKEIWFNHYWMAPNTLHASLSPYHTKKM